jgi:hypothetical protein
MELPESVLETSRITVDQEHVLFTASLCSARQFHLIYRLDAPIGPVGVLIEDGDGHVPQDVTSAVMPTTRRSRATDIYRALCRKYMNPGETPPADSPDAHHKEGREQDDKAATFPGQPEGQLANRYARETDSAKKEDPT